MELSTTTMFNSTELFVNSSANLERASSFRYFGIVIGIVDILLGTPGNIITIFAVLRNRTLRRQPFNLFVANLCAIDLLTALFMMPFNVTGYILMRWPYGTGSCIFQAFSYFSCGYTSIVCLVAITLNRLLGITFPTRYRFLSKFRVKIALCLCWIVAPAFLLPFLVVSFQALSGGNKSALITGWYSKQFLCTFLRIDGGWSYYMQFLRFLFQLCPALIMIICYSLMFWSIRQSVQRRRKSQHTYYENHSEKDATHSDSLSSRRSSKVGKLAVNVSEGPWNTVYVVNNGQVEVHCNQTFDQVRKKSFTRESRDKEIHLVYVSIIVCGVFMLLFLPSFIINLIPGREKFDVRIHMAASNITWLNSCVNPVIFAAMHRPMKKEYKVVLRQMYAYLTKICNIREKASATDLIDE